jgi:hypothetical protein
MERRMLRLAAGLGAVVFAAACAQNAESPMSPSAVAGESAANPDGSTLKVTAPVPVSPENGARVDAIRPSIVFRNSTGRFTQVPVTYRVQVFDANAQPIAELGVPQDGSGQTTLQAEADLAYDTEYRWRVRAEYQGQAGPWSPIWSFLTPQRVTIGNSGGPVGPPRNIAFGEAVDIIIAIYTAGRYDLTNRSTREQLNLYLEIAVAALHYGHGKWNPKGPDTGWCIKNGGPGRPQSDDVIARCDTRDAWDLVGGIGGPTPFWNPVYIGRLPSGQAIYPPRDSVLSLLP